MIDCHPDADDGAVIHFVLERAVVDGADDAADLFFGIVLDVPHEGLDDAVSLLAAEAFEFVRTFHAGGDLGLEVGDVLRGVACRIFA